MSHVRADTSGFWASQLVAAVLTGVNNEQGDKVSRFRKKGKDS